MEDYDKFVQHRLFHLRKSEEEDSKPPPPSSLIRFHGQVILPPLLSGEQREEMRRHRDAARTAAAHRSLKDGSRMAYVQTLLHSVQLRKTPTLEELLQQSDTKTSDCHNTSGGSASQSYFIGMKDTPSLSLPPDRKEKHGDTPHPLTSTTYSAFIASNVTPQQSCQEGCLIDQHYSQHGSQPSSLNGASHQSVSSGYVTYDNVENTISFSGGSDAGREKNCFGFSEEAHNMSGFFLHETSNTIAKMPHIFSHPPIDGEELERSGLESSVSNDFIEVKDINCSSVQEDSVICDHLPVEMSESSHVDNTEDEDNLPISSVFNPDKHDSLDRHEVPVSSTANTGFSDSPDLSQAHSTHHYPTTKLHTQHVTEETEPADNHADEAKPSEEPYRLSLQALLKKSQEYRRCQRMLRNQAKSSKIQERTQEQPRARAEEQSLSDKENDEFPYKDIVTAEGRKTKERRGSFIPSVETSLQKSWENDETIKTEIYGKNVNFKSEGTHVTGNGNTKEMTCAGEETAFRNNKLNISRQVEMEPEQISTSPEQQPISTETLPVQEDLYLTPCPSASCKGEGKYHTIPVPNFCRSPVHCKSKGSIQDGEAADGAETSNGKVFVKSGLNEGHTVEDVNLGHQNSYSAVDLMVKGDVTGVLTMSSQHIDQLESNLSSLKVLISDLESTMTENLENRSQTKSNMQSECEGIEHSEQPCQGDLDQQVNKLRDDDCSDTEQDQSCKERARRQLLNSLKNMHEDTTPEPSISDTDNVPRIVQIKRTEAVNHSELRLVKTLAAQRGKENRTCKEGLMKSNGQRGGSRNQQPRAKCILSAAQQLRIPDVFRNVPPETSASRNISVLSDTSNHPVEKRNQIPVEGHDSAHSPSLNQSYDVDTPSGLWLLEGPGSELASTGHLVQEKHLTSESEGEGQGGLSRVKRRLLMHVTDETQERSTDGSTLRPDSRTPRAAVQWYEGHAGQKDNQERLRQAHAAQVRALQEEHKRQQEELLQALAVRYHLLQSVSFPCSMSSSNLGDTLTFSTLSQPFSPLSEHHRPLLLAAVKGFLTRRLLKTERVAQLVRTIRDTQQFLHALQQQSPGRGELCSRQDLLLQERVSLQLRAARYEVNDIFFCLSARERMQLISWDRELARERELRRQSGHAGHPKGKSSLSAATQKSLERKRGMIIQKKAAGWHKGVMSRTGHNTGFCAEQQLETKRGQFRANPQRVSKSTYSSRPR